MDENVVTLTTKTERTAPTAEKLPESLEARQPATTEAPTLPSPATGEKRRSGFKTALLGAVALGVIAAGAYYGHDYWTVGRFHVSTDDAYIKADSSAIAPKVSGYLSNVAIGDNQAVKAGQVLATIDDRDYQAAVDQARADVDAAKATVQAKAAALETQKSVIVAAKASIDIDAAN